MSGPWRSALTVLGLLLLALPVWAMPRIAVIIDDLGYRASDLAVARLPGAVTCAVLPGTPLGRRVAETAYQTGKEVMLHQPMEAVGDRAVGPRALRLHMTHAALRRTLTENLAAVPHAVGVNNHKGSLITRHPGEMTWLMAALHEHGGLYFVDSRTTAATVAERMAREQGVPVTRRDIFLDNDRDPAAIRAQFRRLVAQADAEGSAIAIGHPYPETITVLRDMLSRLSGHGVQLVAVSKLIPGQPPKRWRASASR